MWRLPFLSSNNNSCRLICIFLTFLIMILLPKFWVTDAIGVLAAEEVYLTPQKHSNKRFEFDDDQILISQQTLSKATVPADTAKQTAAKTKSRLKEPNPMKLTLEAAINRALDANRGIRDVMDQVEGARLFLVAAEAEFELKIAPAGRARITGNSDEGSTDNLGVGISLQKKIDVGTDIVITPNTRKTDDLYSTGVDAKIIQPLLRGFGKEFNLSGVRSAEFGARAAQRNLYLRQVRTVLLTIGAVYDVIKQRELFKLNEASAVRLSVHAEAARAKNKIGVSNQIDVYRAGIQQKQAEENMNNARESYRTALDNLKVLLSLPLDQEIEVEAPLNYTLVKIASEHAVATALTNRVELDQARDNIREAGRLSRLAKQNIWPNFDVILNYSLFDSGENFRDSIGFDQGSWNLGVVTSTDIARTVERVAYDQSLLNLQGAKRNYNLLRDEVTREVKRDFINLRGSENSIAIREEQIKQSNGQLELAQVKFRYGLASNFDLVDAETKLQRSQTDLLSTVIDYIIGTNRLRASLGTLLERPKKF
jgi:outer membrane protein